MPLKKTLANFIAKNSYRRTFHKIEAIFKYYHHAFSNFNYDWHTNGEEFVIDILAHHFSEIDNPVIFDVGANIGDWSNIAATKFPSAKIYAFEPIASTFSQFKENTQAHKNITVFNLGLSDKEEQIKFAHNPDQNALTSAVIDAYDDVHHYVDHSIEEGKVSTGDIFCVNKNIQHIHFLKIDTEGYESHVLQGFHKMLEENKISVIQFEYGRAGIFCGCLLKTLYDLLKNNYEIGKIYPNRVHFKNYSSLDEDFLGPNYLAVLKKETSLIQTLSTIKK